MALNQNFNANPYYDDFDEDKQFLKILFRPGYAVQARELTQLQSIVQKQVDRFGKHIFKNGSMVLGGQTSFENQGVTYLKLQDNDLNSNVVNVDNFVGKTITDSATKSVRAIVVGVQAKTTTTPNTLVVKYLSPNTIDASTNIEDADEMYFATTASSDHAGDASILNISDGVFFYDGYFIKVLPQTIVLDAYGTTPTYRVGLEVDEMIVDENSDSSLLDPALEASNYQAPGATRYKVTLTLSKRSLDSVDDSSFINLVVIEDGIIKKRIVNPDYAVLEDTLARRTFDESGNYTVTPFKVSFSNDTVQNNGEGFSNAYNIIVSAGKAYVRGYEFETIAPTKIVAERAQDYASRTNYNLTFDYQNYIDITNWSGQIDLVNYTPLTIHCVPHQDIVTTNATTYNATSIGTVRVRALDYVYGANNTSQANAVYRAYVFDTNIGSKTGSAQIVGSLDSINVISGGDSTYEIPTVQVLGPNTTTATATVNVKVTNVTIANAGTGYANGDVLTANTGTGNYANLTVTNIISTNGAVLSVAITNTGKYSAVPTVNLNPFLANTSTLGRNFTANLRFGIHSVTLSNSGNGYNQLTTSVVASANGLANASLNVVVTPSGSAKLNLDSSFSTVNTAYRGAKIRLLGYANQVQANTFGNNKMFVANVRNTAITIGQNVFGPNVPSNTLVTSIDYTSNLVTLSSVAGETANGYTYNFARLDQFKKELESKVVDTYDGTSRTIGIADSTWTSTVNSATIFSLDFQFRDAESFVTANSNYQLPTKVNISTDSKYSVLLDLYQGAFLSETDFNKLIYELPNFAIKTDSISNVSFFARKVYSGTFGGLDTLSITTDTGLQSLVNGSLSGADAIENFMVVIRDGNSTLANNTVINFFNNDTNNVTVSTVAGVSTVDIKAAGASGAKADVYMKVEIPEEYGYGLNKLKIRQNANTSVVTTTGGEQIVAGDNIVLYTKQVDQPGLQLVIKKEYTTTLQTPNKPQSLYVSDVIYPLAVYDFGANTPTTANLVYANNIIDSYSFDNGQRDNSYEHSSIILKSGYTKPTGNVVIFADFYEHSGKGYFTANSYTGTDYVNFPVYVSPNDGKSYRLRDCVDFRPSRKNGVSGILGQYNELLLGISGTSFQLDYSYYLPRIDKLVVTKNKQFDVIRGISSLTPVPPKDRDDAMTIYTLVLPAYTGQTEEIKARFVENRRYTMRDIGEIEQRVQNLEFFTTLSWLEKQSIQEQITDEISGLPRVKTGIVVDPFTGHNIADVTNEDYNAAIDIQTGELRPSVKATPFRFELKSLEETFAQNGNIITPRYTENTYIQQAQVSFFQSINPFNLVNGIGSVQYDDLDPMFPDTEQPPEVLDNQNGVNDSWAYCEQLFRVTKNDDRYYAEFGDRARDYKCYGREWNWWLTRVSSKNFNYDQEVKNLQKAGLYDDKFDDFVAAITTDLLNGVKAPTEVPKNLTTLQFSVDCTRKSKATSFRAEGLVAKKKVSVYLNDVDVTNYVLKPDVIQIQHGANNKLTEWTFDFKRGEKFVIATDANKTTAKGRIDYIERVTDNIANVHVYVEESGDDSLYNKKDTQRVVLFGANTYLKSSYYNTEWYDGKTKKIRKGYNKIIAFYPGFSLVNVATSNTIQVTGKFANSNTNLVSTTITVISGKEAGGKYNVTAWNATTRTITVDRDFDTPLGTIYKTDGTKGSRERDRSMITIGDLYTDNTGVIPGIVFTPSIVDHDIHGKYIVNHKNHYHIRHHGKDILKLVTANTSTANTTSPFAQTFFVDDKVYPQGVQLTSVKLLFAGKDSSLPINIQIRQTNADGSPIVAEQSNVVVEGSSVYLYPNNVTVISNTTMELINANNLNPFMQFRAKSPSESNTWAILQNSAPYFTEVKFNAPVKLEPNKTYALSLSSPSGAYSCYMASVGQKILGTTRLISTQPYVGVLYKAQRSDIWTPYPNEDLAFELTRAQYPINTPVTVRLVVRARPTDVDDYGIQGTNVLYENAPETNVNYNAVYVSTEENAFVNANVTFRYESILPNGTKMSYLPIQPGVTSEIYDDYGPRVVTSSNDSFTLEATLTTINPDIAPSFDLSKVRMVVSENIIDNNDIANTDISIIDPGQDHNANTISVTISGGGGSGATAVANVTAGKAVDAIYIVNAGSGYTGSPTVTIRDSQATKLAEVVIIGEDQPKGGVAKTKYITRKITLADGFDGGDLRVLFSARKPRNCEIDVYYKVLSQDDADSLENKRWTQMTLVGGMNNYSDTQTDYKNYIYAPGKDGIPDNYINYDGFTNFKHFAIKVVLRSTNSNKVPKLKNFRAIALSELL